MLFCTTLRVALKIRCAAFQREGFFAGLSSGDENPFGLFIAMETFAGLKSFGFRSAR
jgi:hypothetical protein